MYKYFLILFFSLCLQLSAQINTQYLSGNWARVKVSMADGSKTIKENNSDFLRWKVSDKKICENKDALFTNGPIPQACSEYTIENNFIRTYPESGYSIEKLDNDSLIVVEKLKDITQKDKLRKLWFVKTDILQQKFLSKNKNDSILIASREFSPSTNKNIQEEILNTLYGKVKSPFSIMGNIIIQPQNKKVILEILNGDQIEKKNNKNIDIIKSIIENSFNTWNLVPFNNFNKIKIPYIFNIKSDGEISYLFFKNNINDLKKNTTNITLSKNSFREALKVLQNKKYNQAIELFRNSYENDESNIDALYNIAAIYGMLNDTKNACTTLSKLKNLGQTEATNIFNEKCKNIQ